MNRILTTVLIVLMPATAGFVVGQERSGPQRPGPERRSRRNDFSRSRATLSLPSELVTQLKRREQLDDARARWLDDLAKQYDERLLALRKEFVAQCQRGLSAEQHEALKRMVDGENEARSERRSRRPLTANDPRMVRMLARRLEVTDVQRQQIDALFAQHEAQIEALGDNEPAIEAQNEHTSAQMRAVLTPEQQQQLDEFKERFAQSRERGRSRRSRENE